MIKMILLSLLSFSALAGHINPKDGLTYQELLEGPIQNKKWDGRYDQYQYVTYYNVTSYKRVLPQAPAIKENCHEEGDRFANWAMQTTISRNFSLSASAELLGLIGLGAGLDFTREVSFSFERWAHAQRGVEAIHRVYINGETYIGKTYLKLINTSTGEEKVISHPFKSEKFKLEDQNLLITVEREITGECRI